MKRDWTRLGLSVSYRIIKEHKGKLEFTSDIVKVTEFNIYLPLLLKFLQHIKNYNCLATKENTMKNIYRSKFITVDYFHEDNHIETFWLPETEK